MSPICLVPLLLFYGEMTGPIHRTMHSGHKCEIFANVVSFETQGLDVNQYKRSVLTIFSSSIKYILENGLHFLPISVSSEIHVNFITEGLIDCISILQIFTKIWLKAFSYRYHFFCV